MYLLKIECEIIPKSLLFFSLIRNVLWKQTYTWPLCDNTGCISRKERLHFHKLFCTQEGLKQYVSLWYNPYRIWKMDFQEKVKRLEGSEPGICWLLRTGVLPSRVFTSFPLCALRTPPGKLSFSSGPALLPSSSEALFCLWVFAVFMWLFFLSM